MYILKGFHLIFQANDDTGDPEKLEFLEKQVEDLQQELNSVNTEKSQLLKEKADLLAKFNDQMEVDSLKVQLEETSKVKGSSKNYVDKMLSFFLPNYLSTHCRYF